MVETFSAARRQKLHEGLKNATSLLDLFKLGRARATCVVSLIASSLSLFTNVEINDGTVVLYFGKEHLKCSDEGLKALLNDMNNDIQQLRTQLQNVSTN